MSKLSSSSSRADRAVSHSSGILASLLVLCWTCSAAFSPPPPVQAASGRSSDPHPFTDQAAADCLECHASEPTGTATGNYTSGSRLKDTAALCLSCHKDEGESHPMKDVKLDFAPPADLPLDPAGEMTCITCHSAHGERFSTREYSSESPLARIVGRFSSKKRKTYFLRRPNSKGELCLACHK